MCAINIDEGEPGTFKDRLYMLSDPHRFLEGMLIATRVIGIDACYIYIRDEYPSVIQNLRNAVDHLVQKSGYDLPRIEIRRAPATALCRPGRPVRSPDPGTQL
jgi:formate dehydrogenase